MSDQQNYQPGNQDNPYGAAAPVPGQAQAPGLQLGKIGMILAIIPCTATIGLILSIVGMVQSRGAGVENKNAKIGIIVGIVWIVISIVANVVLYSTGALTTTTY